MCNPPKKRLFYKRAAYRQKEIKMNLLKKVPLVVWMLSVFAILIVVGILTS